MSLLDDISAFMAGVDPLDDGQVNKLISYIKEQVDSTDIERCREILASMIIYRTLGDFVNPCRELINKINSQDGTTK